MGMSTGIWHSNSPHQVPFVGLRFGCTYLCLSLRQSWDKEPRRAGTARRDAKGEGPELGRAPPLPRSPNLFHTKSQPGARTTALCLCSALLISVPAALFSQQLHSSAHKCSPNIKEVTQKTSQLCSIPAFPPHCTPGSLAGLKMVSARPGLCLTSSWRHR